MELRRRGSCRQKRDEGYVFLLINHDVGVVGPCRVSVPQTLRGNGNC